jgi:hypothetical protein
MSSVPGLSPVIDGRQNKAALFDAASANRMLDSFCGRETSPAPSDATKVPSVHGCAAGEGQMLREGGQVPIEKMVVH